VKRPQRLKKTPIFWEICFIFLSLISRAWVSTGATGARHPLKFWTSPPAPADFEVLNTTWNPQSSFYVTSGTLSFKFQTQALIRISELYLKVEKNLTVTSKRVWFHIVDLFIICLINKSRQYDTIIISHQVCEQADKLIIFGEKKFF
jgi:hypothetical protein